MFRCKVAVGMRLLSYSATSCFNVASFSTQSDVILGVFLFRLDMTEFPRFLFLHPYELKDRSELFFKDVYGRAGGENKFFNCLLF